MQTQKRHSYLENWMYPAVAERALSVRDIEQEFSKIMAGMTPKKPSFLFAGRIAQPLRSSLTQADASSFRLVLESDGRETMVGFEPCWEESQILLNEVLSQGDLILLEADWNGLLFSGLFPKLEGVQVKKIELLAPAKTMLPAQEFTFKKSKQWNLFLDLVRKCFDFLGFQEMRTPTLVPSPGLEPHLDPFSVEFKVGSQIQTLFLPTSPEFHLKKLLCQGHTKIFEFKESFRNGELGSHHQPEFLMMEWYRAYAPLTDIVKDLKGLLNYLKLHWPEPIKGWSPLRETTMSELFLEKGLTLTPQTSLDELRSWSQKLSIELLPQDSWDDVFFRIFLKEIEPTLGAFGPVLVKNYPPSQCAWARINKEGWSDRFELYWRGFELANAYHEVNDPIEQQTRFEKANEERVRLGKQAMPLDQELLEMMEAGMPPSAGIALGLERLFLCLTDGQDLNQARAFTVNRLRL